MRSLPASGNGVVFIVPESCFQRPHQTIHGGGGARGGGGCRLRASYGSSRKVNDLPALSLSSLISEARNVQK